MSTEFKENTRLWYSYENVHEHSSTLYKNMQIVEPGAANLIAIGRGGWIPTRIVAANFESDGIPVTCYSVGASYVRLGNPTECVELTQGLDRFTTKTLIQKTKASYSVWVVDGPYLAGRTVTLVKNYIQQILEKDGIDKIVRVGVLHWIQFDSCPEAPWRLQASVNPDAWGEKIHNTLKPYVEYPWEYGNIDHFKERLKK